MYFSVHMRFCVPSRMHLVVRPSHVCVGAVRALTPLRRVYINVMCAVRFDHYFVAESDRKVETEADPQREIIAF